MSEGRSATRTPHVLTCAFNALVMSWLGGCAAQHPAPEVGGYESAPRPCLWRPAKGGEVG